LLTTCKAVLFSLEHMLDKGLIDFGGSVPLIEPPFGAEAIHETIFDRLDQVVCQYGGYEYNRCEGGTFTQALKDREPNLFRKES